MNPLPPGPYRLCLMDPPWAFRTFNSAGKTPTSKSFREAEDHYPTMSIADMAALPVGQMMAKDSAIAMWIVGSHCDAALELANGWGFTFTTDLFCWMKQRLAHAWQLDLLTGDIPEPRISMGYYTRKQVEMCWLFQRGRGLPVLAHDVRQVILSTPTGHSRKPPEQYDRLNRLFGTDLPRIEMFARNTAAGWDSWGNEVGKFDRARAQAAAGDSAENGAQVAAGDSAEEIPA